MKIEIIYSFSVREWGEQDFPTPWTPIVCSDPEKVFYLRQGFMVKGFEVSDVTMGQIHTFTEEEENTGDDVEDTQNVVPFNQSP